MQYLGTTTSNEQDICNLFSKYFQSVYASDLNEALPVSNCNQCIDIGSLVLSLDEVMEALLGLDVNKGEGPDNYPPILLKKCATALAQPLLLLFNLSLSEGLFLNIWKTSYLTPIFKSGSKQVITNYRPICKISALPKLFEKLVYKRISLLVHEKISIYQHGFIQGKSTATNLILITNAIMTNMEKGLQTDIIFTDFAKAFDRVNHRILVHKLYCFGFHNTLLKWLESYLTGRTQNVKLFGCLSESINVSSGVPQGSHLGPLLFLIFINDIPDIFKNSSCLLFADDLKLYRAISSTDDCHLLLNDLNILVDWCKNNLLHLNVAKCQAMSCYRNRNPIGFEYMVDNTNLERVKQKKILESFLILT